MPRELHPYVSEAKFASADPAPITIGGREVEVERKQEAAAETSTQRRRERMSSGRKALAETLADEGEWNAAAEKVAGKLGDKYPLLAAEPDAGELVIQEVRRASERLSWRDAAKRIDDRLRAEAEARDEKPAEPKSRTVPEGTWDKAAHRARSLAALRAAAKE